MRMPGTVKCRPTVAYWVQIDGINIATELITRYYLTRHWSKCCFNARPTFGPALNHHWIIVQCLWERPPAAQQTQDICITFIQRRPNVFDVGPALHKVIQMFCDYWVSIQAFGVKQFPNPRSRLIQSVGLWVWNAYLVLLWNRALAYPRALLPSGGPLSRGFWQLTTPLRWRFPDIWHHCHFAS